MKRGSGEGGVMLLELLIAVLLAGMAFQLVLPAVWRAYQHGAVRFEAEHLLGEIRCQQMLARTEAGSIAEDGSAGPAAARPCMKIDGEGYVIYRGGQSLEKHRCLPTVHMQFMGNWDGKDQFLYFGENGNIYPNITILILGAAGEDINCHVVIDTAGRVRLERSGT